MSSPATSPEIDPQRVSSTRADKGFEPLTLPLFFIEKVPSYILT